MKIALINGHSKLNKGALNIEDNIHEYDFNKKVINKVLDYYSGNRLFDIDVKDFYRDGISRKKVAHKINEWCANISIELHFNSYTDPTVSGHEVLYSIDSQQSKPYAEMFNNIMNKKYPYQKDRGLKVIYQGEDGHENLIHLNCPAILIEPFFGSNSFDCMTTNQVFYAIERFIFEASIPLQFG